MEPVFVYIDDDPASRLVMEILLQKRLGYRVVHILPDSADVIARLDAIDPPPTIFLLDIHMAPLDGFEVLALLREHPRYQGATMIALTASVMAEEIGRLREAGFDSMVAKPVKQDTFPELLRRILAGEKLWRL